MKRWRNLWSTILKFVYFECKSIILPCNKKDLDIPRQLFNDQEANEKNQMTPTTKALIFSTEEQNSYFYSIYYYNEMITSYRVSDNVYGQNFALKVVS